MAPATIPPPNVTEPSLALEMFLSSLNTENASEEDKEKKRDSILITSDDLFGSALDGAIAILDSAESVATKITSPASGRYLYFVRGQGNKDKGPQSYVCILPTEKDIFPVTFCSCRSFFELSKCQSQNPRWCKHLLALQLMPHLNVKCAIVETQSDIDYSRLVRHRIGI